VYVSSWLKWRYPAAFAAALLNSQPMGFYAPAQIVRDARGHGVEVREVDVNCSEWDCTLEVPLPSGAEREITLRLGLRQVDGLQRDAADRVVARRPYATVEELRSRGGVPVDWARPAGGAVGFARPQAGAGPAALRLCRGARRRCRGGAGTASGDAARRAC